MAAQETAVLAETAFVFGLASYVFLVLPFVLYAVKMNDNAMRQEGPLRIFGEIAFMHIGIVAVAIILTAAYNGIMARADFKPAEGLSYFYGLHHGGTPWDFWLSKSVSSFQSQGKEGEILTATVLVMQYISLFLFLTYLLIPLGVLWNTFSAFTNEAMIRESSVGSNSPTASDYFSYARAMALKFAIVVIVVVFHLSLASLYVNVIVGGNFSHYALMSNLWHSILME